MHNFCTLFDFRYLSRGLALYDSLKRHSPGFRLYVLAMDDACLESLSQMNLVEVVPISLRDFENAELTQARKTRTRQEYCWTCTPAIIRYCLVNFALTECTYLDADIFFFADPGILIAEMGMKSVLITPHRYSPEYDQSATSGIYCVQFVTFRADLSGMQILNTWYEQCLNWCYARYEDGKFGDQKYLDNWPESYPQVHVLNHIGGGLAPWNLRQYDIGSSQGSLFLKRISENSPIGIIFYHFHDFYFDSTGSWFHTNPAYFIGDDVYNLIYTPYLEHLSAIGARIGFPMNTDIPAPPLEVSVRVFEEIVLHRTQLLEEKALLRQNYSLRGDKYQLIPGEKIIERQLLHIFLRSGYNLSQTTFWDGPTNPIFLRITGLENRINRLKKIPLFNLAMKIYGFAKRFK